MKLELIIEQTLSKFLNKLNTKLNNGYILHGTIKYPTEYRFKMGDCMASRGAWAQAVYKS